MWLNISATNGDEDAAKSRDIIAKRMTPANILTAQKLERECFKKKYKWCRVQRNYKSRGCFNPYFFIYI